MIEVIVAGVVVAISGGLGAVFRSKRKRTKTLHLSHARDDTQDQITAMSDLILDLEPHLVISNNLELKERFVEAGKTFSDVRDRAERATSGHQVADLRIDIAKARWKLDAIEAELNGKPVPAEPFTRDSSGTAWDSTRGTGA